MNLKQVDLTLEKGAIFQLQYPSNWGELEEGE